MKNCVKYIALTVSKFCPVRQPYYVARQSVNTYCTITKCNYFLIAFLTIQTEAIGKYRKPSICFK